MDNNSGEDEKKPPANGNEDELRDLEPEVSPPQVDQGEGENLVAGSLESEQDVTSEPLVDASGGESGSSSAVGSGSVEGSTCCCPLEEPSATPASTIPDESLQSPQPSTSSTVDEQSMLRAPKKRYRNNRALDLQMNPSVRRRLFTGPEFRQQEPETPTTEQSSEVKMVQGGNGGENVPAAPKKRKRDDDESDEPRKRLRTLAQMSGVRRRLFSPCAAEASSSSSSSDDSQKKTQEKETHEQKAEDEGIQQEQKAEDESQRPDEREHREISAAVASIVQGFVEEIIAEEEQVDVGQEFSPESVEVANLMEELVETVVLQDSVVSGSGETLDDDDDKK